MINSRAKKTLMVLGLILLGVLGGLVYTVIHNKSFSATITTEAAPLDTFIKLDGHKARNGPNRVKPGTYQATFTREGFVDETHSVTASDKGSQYIGVIMSPSSTRYSNWYATHPDDARQAEAISSHNFDRLVSNQVGQEPILKKLPYVAPTFRIDTGVSQKFPNDSSKVALYISITSDQDKKLATDWLKSQGADPSKLEIVFRSYPTKY